MRLKEASEMSICEIKIRYLLMASRRYITEQIYSATSEVKADV